jgi:hypothetical protein
VIHPRTIAFKKEYRRVLETEVNLLLNNVFRKTFSVESKNFNRNSGEVAKLEARTNLKF